MRNSILGRYTHTGSRVSVGGGAKHPLDWVSIGSFQNRNDCWKSKSSIIPFDEGDGVNIGSDVWIADNSVVMGNVSLGVGSVIGADSVAVKDVPPYMIACGNTAREIRMRFDQIHVDHLLKTHWWNKTPKELEGLTMNDPNQFSYDFNSTFN